MGGSSLSHTSSKTRVRINEPWLEKWFVGLVKGTTGDKFIYTCQIRDVRPGEITDIFCKPNRWKWVKSQMEQSESHISTFILKFYYITWVWLEKNVEQNFSIFQSKKREIFLSPRLKNGKLYFDVYIKILLYNMGMTRNKCRVNFFSFVSKNFEFRPVLTQFLAKNGHFQMSLFHWA